MEGQLNRLISILAVLLVPALLLSALAGCGGGKDPAAILRAGLEKSSAAVSLQADLLVETEPGSGSRSIPLSLTGTIAVDQVANSAEIGFTMMGFSGEVRYVDGQTYLQLGEEWFSLAAGTGNDFLSGLATGVAGTAFSYPQLLGEYTSVEDLGTAKVAGRQCDHLKINLDLQSLADLPAVKKIGDLLGVDPADLFSELEKMAPEVEVWVDTGDSYIRKITITADLDLGNGALDLGINLLKGGMRVTGTVVFNEYNLPLDIKAPTSTKPFDSSVLPF